MWALRAATPVLGPGSADRGGLLSTRLLVPRRARPHQSVTATGLQLLDFRAGSVISVTCPSSFYVALVPPR